MKQRLLQVNDLYADTDMGNLLLNAFYYTRSKKDISAGIDEHISRQHPEWLRREKYGEDQDATGFRRLCFNSEYLDILKEQTREVVERYKPDGVFFDIISTWPCYCDNCLAEMKRRGLDPKDACVAEVKATRQSNKG